MDGIVALLKDTPIPTILVVSGIVFLFLALAGQIAGKLEVPPERQKWSALAGGVLLAAGLLLYILPGSPGGSQGAEGGSATQVAATQPLPVTQALAAGDGGAAPTAAQGAAGSETAGAALEGAAVSQDLEGCFEEVFAGIPDERVAEVEIGTADKELLGTNQAKDEPAGVVVEELGQPAAAITYLFFEDDQLFKIGTVVDASCQPLAFSNGSRGGARDVLQNWDTLEVSTASGVYYLRFGYDAGTVDVGTGKSQE